MDLALFLLVLLLVATWVSSPLRRGVAASAPAADEAVALERESRLEAVRDAELDARMGKLTDSEHRELDAELRSEAIAALRAEGERR